MTHRTPVVANHHADHGGFAGLSGLLIGLTMTVRRGATARLVADLTHVSSTDHVVDVGCGPGTAVREAARRGARATGVDPAPVMLRLSRLLTRDRRADWLVGSAESIPLPDASASVLWSVATVHHWVDVDRGLAEAHRVLSPEGRLLAAERRVRAGATGHASHGWTDEQANVFAEACREASFTDVRVETHDSDRGRLLVVRSIRSR